MNAAGKRQTPEHGAGMAARDPPALAPEAMANNHVLCLVLQGPGPSSKSCGVSAPAVVVGVAPMVGLRPLGVLLRWALKGRVEEAL